MSNSAYADQRRFGGPIANISNSPFTDERRQGGGGVPGDGTGNVQYDIADQTLNTRLEEVNTIITDIDQGLSCFVIGNDAGSLNFDTMAGDVKLSHAQNQVGNIQLKCDETTGGNGNIILTTETAGQTGAGNLNANIASNILLNAQQAVSLTSGQADVSILAEEISRVQGKKASILQSGLVNGTYENQINMETDALISLIEMKSEGDTATNSVNIITRTTPNQGCSLSLNSTVTPTVPDRIINSVTGIPPFNPLGPDQSWFTVQGRAASDGLDRKMLFFEKKAQFSHFDTIAFSGGTVDPVFEFKADQFYQFINNPLTEGALLTVTTGSGIETDPWGLEWLLPASGGDGNVTSDFLTDRLTRDNGAGTQVLIETIDQGDNPFTIKNYGENEINMTREREFGQPNEKATIELKSFGDAFENRILLNTFTTASTGTSLLMTSSDDVSQPNSIRFTTSNIIQDSIIPYFQADGSPNGTAARRRFSLSDKEAYFGSFRVLNFSGVNTGQAGFNPSYKWNGANYYRWDNTPVQSQGVMNSVLTVTSGNGLEVSPFSMNWVNAPTGNDLDTLDITYDQTTSVLVLSDPVDGVISTTTVVPGRTVLISDVTVNSDIPLVEHSMLGLSNTIFPPVAVTHLIGNNPPRVSLNATGLTNWFVGASFKISIAGELLLVPVNDILTLRVWSNRGQTSANLLNSFEVKMVLINSLSFGWSWDVNFTCRSVNDGNILGVIATASKFQYSDDDSPPVSRVLGRQVSNTSSSFDTSVDQYLDCTIESDVGGNFQTRLQTTTCTIERIY